MYNRAFRTWAGTAVCGLMLMTGCSDRADLPTGVEVQFAKGGGGPTVEAADPSSAPQEITLDVRVIGSGFDKGSTVKFLLAGQSTTKIVTHSTTFIDRKNVIANITIPFDADVALYDIVLTTSRGKKGIGSEIFSVKKKGDTEPEFVITTTHLGTLEGRSGSVARSIVSAPIRVVGGSGTEDGAFYWTPGEGMVELTAPAEPNGRTVATKAFDINDGGQIVGERWVWRDDPEPSGSQPLFWSSSQAEAIVLPGPGRSSHATAINNSGQIVGNSCDPFETNGFFCHAMLWTVDGTGTVTTRDLHEETFRALGFLNSNADDINDSGQVSGEAYDGFRSRAFLWDNGVVTILDVDLDPSLSSFSSALNNAVPVQIAGGAHLSGGGSRRALLWTGLSDGTVLTEELPPPAGFEWGWATEPSDIGEVVGNARPDNNQDDRAILWTFHPQTGERIPVDLGVGGAEAIDRSASLAGPTRVVGSTTMTSGKGKNKTKDPRAILWEVEPIG